MKYSVPQKAKNAQMYPGNWKSVFSPREDEQKMMLLILKHSTQVLSTL